MKKHNNTEFYLHGITRTPHGYDQKKILTTLKEILSSGAILSLRKQNIVKPTGFNGVDYISLCDYKKRNTFPKGRKYYNAYELYIKSTLSLMFPKDKINSIKPTLVDITQTFEIEEMLMEILGNSNEGRYSDLCDEVQVKDEIPLSLMSGLTIPIKYMYNMYQPLNKNVDTIVEYIDEISTLLKSHNYYQKIYDLETLISVEKHDNIKKLIKKDYLR